MTAAEAIRKARKTNGAAIRKDGIISVVPKTTAEDFEAAGQAFAYIGEAPNNDGRWVIVYIPVGE